ncbi:MAG: hypothetical protein H0W11_14280 [Gemmatimonadetes bacterium]|nr:hypothetical protein [Gemmatimonadota bacterium]
MRSVRPALALLAGVLALLTTDPAQAQNPETSPRDRRSQDAVVEPGPQRVSKFGTRLSNTEAGALLQEMRELTEQALAASRAAEQATSVQEVKAAAERVFQAVWGIPSGMVDGGATEVREHGWKTRWQVTGAEFDPKWIERLGTAPPEITDPRQLGIMGRGRAVRGRLEQMSAGSSHVFASQTRPADGALAALNNVIGWTYITTGLKVTEVQPRISLTHVWDAPAEFWNSSADTGWLPEAHAQAINILKTNYESDVAEARRHAAGMRELLEKVLNGVDADQNGTIEAKPMEGGLNVVFSAAAQAGMQVRQAGLEPR